jgi:hypothetical protein
VGVSELSQYSLTAKTAAVIARALELVRQAAEAAPQATSQREAMLVDSERASG